jgi:hypothetical protein
MHPPEGVRCFGKTVSHFCSPIVLLVVDEAMHRKRKSIPDLAMSRKCRYCCKSLFALVIKNSPGCRRDFRVKMWGTSSPDDKLTGDLDNVIEITQVGGSRSDRLTARKSSPGNFGLLQHNLPIADSCGAATAPLFNFNEQSERRRRWLLRLWAECPLGVPLWAVHFGCSELPCILLVTDFLVLRACQ